MFAPKVTKSPTSKLEFPRSALVRHRLGHDPVEQRMRAPEPAIRDIRTCGQECSQPERVGDARQSKVSPIVRPTAEGAGLGISLDPPTRAAMEARFGFNFSRVRIHTGEEAERRAHALGVAAYTQGETIGFGPGLYTQATERGRRLLAHELAHVVQQQQGLTRGLEFGARPTLEADAEQSARIVTAGGSVRPPPRLGPPAAVVQGFDPEYHEQAVIGGLTGIFTPGEIGKIYEANWRRDFSQGSPLIGQIVLVWKELRDKAAVTGQPDRDLQWQLLKLVSHPLKDFIGESYGGYQYWEHMDNPGADAAAEAEARWAGGDQPGGKIAGYIRDSRASIKDKLASAIRIARASWGGTSPDSGRTRADAWSRGKPPADYDLTNAYAGRTRPPQGYDLAKSVSDPTHSSTIVAKEVEAIAGSRPGHIADSTIATAGFGADPSVPDNLGRASHLIEDFFAHSNFVELTAQQMSGQTIAPELLRTGTFETPDKLHSLAGKLRDAAKDMRANRNLIPLIGDAAIGALEAVASGAESASAALGPKPGSHTRLAKDSPNAQGFPMAHRLATAADQMVFFWVHRIMQEASSDKADKNTYILFQLIDEIVNIPSDHHPLKNVYGGGAAAPTE